MKEEVMRYPKLIIIAAMVMSLIVPGLVFAGDLDDGISKYTDESIAADDTMGKPGTNINFIVLDAMAQAKAKQKKGGKGDKTSNFNDGSGDNNENSVVIGPGTQTGNIYNVIIQK